jgi:tRNA pseudouridine55 synthase
MKFAKSGILLVDKGEGPSSAHVVAHAKRILGARKVGHLGTLDPFASGLLPLGINEGTKIAQTFLDADKSYTGTMILGAETDSQDRTGRLLRQATVPELAVSDLAALRRAFTGQLAQIPPMFSALKQNGVRLYELARRGEAVPREPRCVQIRSLDLWLNSPKEIGFALACSKGTYVRTLVADMGRELRCGAYVGTLRRVACGPFEVSSAVTLEDLDAFGDGAAVPLIPMNAALAHLPAVAFKAPAVLRIRAGQQEALSAIGEPKRTATTLRILDQNEDLVALVEWLEARGAWKLVRVFNG